MVLRPTQPSPGIGPGWYVTVPDTVTAGLALGNYQVDASVHISGATFVTETITIQVISSVSLGS
jgi:hypothetical protein